MVVANEDEQFRNELAYDVYTDEEINIYIRLRKEGMAEVGATEMLASFSIKELRAIMRFRDFYGHYFSGPVVN